LLFAYVLGSPTSSEYGGSRSPLNICKLPPDCLPSISEVVTAPRTLHHTSGESTAACPYAAYFVKMEKTHSRKNAFTDTFSAFL
jgi:hypothetical protein